jgi:HK97 family phage prohead protease
MKKKNQTNQKEVRVRVAPQKFEVRKNSDGSRSLSGYAATFGDLSEPLGGFREKIQRGAFSQSLKNNDVLCLYSHNDSQVLGRVSSGTLKVEEDSTGLFFQCKLPDTSTARDLITLLERGDISQMSFGFVVNPDGDTWEQIGGEYIRTLTSVTLFEISVVAMPAYTSTSVNLRSAPKAIRRKLRDADTDDDPSDITDDDEEDDGDDDDDECGCDCDECKDGDCENCTDPDCDDERCLERDCAMQTRSLHLNLIARRLR